VPVSVPILMLIIPVPGSVPCGPVVISSVTVAVLVPFLNALVVGAVVWVVILLSSVLVILPTVLLFIIIFVGGILRVWVLEAASDGDLYVKLGPDNVVVHIHPQIS